MKFSKSLLKAARRKRHVRLAAQGLLRAVQEQGCKGVDRRVHVAEVPFVGGNLPVGVQVEPMQHQVHLLLREIRVDDREWQRVEGQIPGRVPGVLPLVRHRDDVFIDHVEPLRVPGAMIAGMERIGIVFLQPAVPVEEEELLAPQHAGQGLAHHVGGVRGDGRRGHGTVELVRLLEAGRKGFVNPRPERDGEGLIGEAQAHRHRLAGAHHLPIVRRGLRALVGRIHCRLAALHHRVIDPVLGVRKGIGLAGKQPVVVRAVLAKEQRHLALAVQIVRAQGRMPRLDRPRARCGLDLCEAGFLGRSVRGGNPKGPVVPKPQGRQEM